MISGGEPPSTGKTEQWNGSSWTEVAEVNTPRAQGGGAGTYTDAVLFGGYTFPSSPRTANTEIWNGSSWTEVGDLNTATGNTGHSANHKPVLYKLTNYKSVMYFRPHAGRLADTTHRAHHEGVPLQHHQPFTGQT